MSKRMVYIILLSGIILFVIFCAILTESRFYGYDAEAWHYLRGDEKSGPAMATH